MLRSKPVIKKRHLKLKKKFKIFFIIYFCFVLLVTSNYSLAKFKTSVSKENSISIAKPIANLVSKDVDKIEFSLEDSNYVATYKFSIVNYENEKINEVDLKYFLSITIGDEFTYYLYKDSISDDNLISNVSEYYDVLGHESKEEHKYVLKIVYNPETSKDAYETDLNVEVLYIQQQ